MYELDLGSGPALTVNLDSGLRALFATHFDPVDRVGKSQRDLETFPVAGQHRLHQKPIALLLDAEDAFHRRAVHPAGRARVPGPAATPALVRRRLDVGSHDIGLGAILFRRLLVE